MAESVLLSDDDYNSYLVIRSKNGSEQRVQLPDSTADMFLRWVDDTHLQLWREPMETDAHVPDEVAGVHLALKNYALPAQETVWYDHAGLHVETVAVPADGVSARFAARPDGSGKSCILTLVAKPNPPGDKARVEINARINPRPNKPRPAGGIETRFVLDDSHPSRPQSMLTSATISEIPSYNRVPEGSGGTSVRGQFLEQNAATLINDLSGRSISLDFSRDFYSRVLRYQLPLSGAGQAVKDFLDCVGNTDMLWIRHDP